MEPRDPAVCNVSDHKEGKDEMTKASESLQDLRQRIYVKAKTDTSWRFWGLYVHVCKMETLREAYDSAKNNDGAPGIDGVTFEATRPAATRCLLPLYSPDFNRTTLCEVESSARSAASPRALPSRAPWPHASSWQ